ncbi:hypothetical protein WAJ79_08850 [Acinetobacter baumannii]
MDKCREEFEKHYLNLPFHDSKAAQKCLDSCDFDVKQNVYIPNAKWFLDNDTDEGVIYCCMLNTAYMSFQHQQAKVEELEGKLKQAYEDVDTFAEAHERECGFKAQLAKDKAELQKRVKFLEQELGAWKGKSIAAMVNGMCKQCGKEPLQAIVSDKEGYALLHCFGCGADKYELIGEQALKGEG